MASRLVRAGHRVPLVPGRTLFDAADELELVVPAVANDLRRIAGLERGAWPYQLAADLLTGADPYGGEFLMAFRAGGLG